MSFDLICLSHLRWNFVYQRPNHLMSRCARDRRVFFVEEPVDASEPGLEVIECERGLYSVVPKVPRHLDGERTNVERKLIDQLIDSHGVDGYALWYYTPMALRFTRHLRPWVVVYDCMDELSGFRGAPPELLELESELMRVADVVFTGGQSLYEAKRFRHRNVHAFPSSVDYRHFARARERLPDPKDQASIPHPRLGFFGVIDERMDLALIEEIADARPEWQLVMLGPVVKIDPSSLPRRSNIHWLGQKMYAELPAYISGWDVAIMPFAMNDATKFISPTKTLEYLAAGRPVVSTPIRDVVRPYESEGLVKIAADAPSFVRAIEETLSDGADPRGWLVRVDTFLASTSWDETWRKMSGLMSAVLTQHHGWNGSGREGINVRLSDRRGRVLGERSGGAALVADGEESPVDRPTPTRGR